MTDKFITPALLPTDNEQEILTILMEEAAEIAEICNLIAIHCSRVAQRASKTIRFGIQEVQSEQPLTNVNRLNTELGDLLAVVDLLVSKKILSEDVIYEAIEAKKIKLDKYLQT